MYEKERTQGSETGTIQILTVGELAYISFLKTKI